jgi:thiosulfate/3-mercaptopyruvate sulfurtransferase
MTYTTLLSTSTLAKHLNSPNWVLIDCRFVLSAPELAESHYLSSHIPGSAYAHLDRDLSSPVISGLTGRHPWPSLEQAVETFSRLGIDETCQVVVYDDAGGALAAVRVWGMLRWLGHIAVAVLDGGWQKWLKEERPVASGQETHPRREFKVQKLHPDWIVSADQVETMRQDSAYRIFDARAAERYRGQNETIDPVAGHIPGAYSAPYLENLRPDLTFLPKSQLHAHYQALLGEVPPENAAFYCGSGVTSIHNILAMLHAGLGEARLYAGSWSEWIAPRTRPVAT